MSIRRVVLILAISSATAMTVFPAAPRRSVQVDSIGDVRDGNGRRPRRQLAGIDLTRVQVEVSDAGIRVAYTASNAFPQSLPSGVSSLWDLTACTPSGDSCVIFRAKLLDSNWRFSTMNVDPYIDATSGSGRTAGRQLLLEYPRGAVPNWMYSAFHWKATAEYNGAETFHDDAPNRNFLSVR